MNTLTTRFLFSLCLGLFCVWTVPRGYSEVVGEWDLGTASIASNSVTVLQSGGIAGELTGTSVAGIRLDAKEGAPSGKALFFGGTASSYLSSSQPIQWDEGRGFRLEVEVNPAGASDGYVVRQYCNFALLYSATKAQLGLIVWLADKTVQSVSMSVGGNEWSKVTAQLSGRELSLSVNGKTERKTIPEGAALAAARTKLWIGPARAQGENSFAGGIGKVRLESLP